MSSAKFLLLLCLASSLQLIYADNKCNAICYMDNNRRLMCKKREDISIEVLHYKPVTCLKKEYPRSTEVIIGKFEEIEGFKKNGLDVFKTSETPSSFNLLQLTIKLKIKVVDPGLFDKLDNLERLELHPFRVNPCAFYTLPKSVKNVLLQCANARMTMLDDLFWPSNSNVNFKINMCLQSTTCYACQPTSTTPFQYVLLKSERKGPLALNKVVSLKRCIPVRCSPEVSVCYPNKTMTTSLPTTTTKMTTTTLKPTTKTTTTTTMFTTTVMKTTNRGKESVTTKNIPKQYVVESYKTKTSSVTMNNFFVMALLGATGINTIILFILVFLVAYAIGCCRKRQRGIYMMPKGNYPPDYSTLRPV